MSLQDDDVWDSRPESEPTSWGEYGEGKTRRQEADDSMGVIVWVAISAVLFTVALVELVRWLH